MPKTQSQLNAKKISKVYPKTALFTVHDSILIPQTEVEKCKEIFLSEYHRALGITPNLKVELYTKPNLEGNLE